MIAAEFVGGGIEVALAANWLAELETPRRSRQHLLDEDVHSRHDDLPLSRLARAVDTAKSLKRLFP